ncbi:unnamed protein product, partial [marine sediment metagenome]
HLYNIEIQLDTDPVSGEPIEYTYNNVLSYTLHDNSITMVLPKSYIASKYDIVHITEI